MVLRHLARARTRLRCNFLLLAVPICRVESIWVDGTYSGAAQSAAIVFKGNRRRRRRCHHHHHWRLMTFLFVADRCDATHWHARNWSCIEMLIGFIYIYIWSEANCVRSHRPITKSVWRHFQKLALDLRRNEFSRIHFHLRHLPLHHLAFRQPLE